MSCKILSGTSLAQQIKQEVKKQAEAFKRSGITPKLVVIMAGDDPASMVYVNAKKVACAEVNIDSTVITFPSTVEETTIIDLIKKLNLDPCVTGILVQLPLPHHINAQNIAEQIDYRKDVDCANPINVGKIMLGCPNFLPCTPSGIIQLILQNGFSIEGKECVIVGRSNIVGKPLSILLLSLNGTVTMCHSKTVNLKMVCKRADILVSAVGHPHLITTEHVKPGALVIDVGITRTSERKLIGDVNFETVSQIASAITPVPKGVGPMTIAMLMSNTLHAAKLIAGR